MYSRKKLYDRIKRLKTKENPSNPLFAFYSEILNHESTGAIMGHFRSMAESILETGTAIPVPESRLAAREALGLPKIRFDTEEVKKLAKKMRALRSD